ENDEEHQRDVDEGRHVDLRHGPVPPPLPAPSAARAARSRLKRCTHFSPPPRSSLRIELARNDGRELVCKGLEALREPRRRLTEIVVENHRRDRGEEA